MMPAPSKAPLSWFFAAACLLSLGGCGSGTDITRTDDDVDTWVAEQRAAEKERKLHSSLPPPAHTAQTPDAPAAHAPAKSPTTQPAQTQAPWPDACTPDWYALVEREVGVADAEGHGPDPGSAEWMSAVEARLGVREDPGFPEPGTPTWCERIDQLVAQRHVRK